MKASNQNKRGFTLVELLSVLTVVALLLGVSASTLTSSLQAQQLSASANRIAGELSALALQSVRENREIQIRLLRQESELGNDHRLRALQAYSVDPTSGDTSPIGEVIPLESGIVVLEDESLSSLTKHQNSVAPEGFFTFHPAGGTDLPMDSTDKWCMTLILERDESISGSGLPANFRTLVINAHTGAIRVY